MPKGAGKYISIQNTMRTLFWFVFFALHQNSQQEIKVRKLEMDKVMAESITTAMTMLAKWKITIRWSAKEQRDLIAEVLRGVKAPVVLNADEVSKRGRQQSPSEVVLAVGGTNIDQLLRNTSWNRDTVFLVVANALEEVQPGLAAFWKHKIVNAFTLLRTEGVDVCVYSFLPYQKGNCTLVSPEIVDKYDSETGMFTNNGAAFKDTKRIKNMNGCPVNITIVDVKPNVIFHDDCQCNGTTNIQGIEGNLMREVARRLNFNGTFVIALDGVGWGWIRPSPSGAVGEVFTGRSDFAIGLLAPTLERFEFLDISLPYNGEECITYGVPTGAGASTPDWITILIFEYNPTIWGLILVSFLLVIVFFEIVNKYFKSGTWLTSKTDVFLLVFSSCLGLPVKVPRHFFLRISFISWITFSFIITVAYRSSMGSKLTVPTKDPDINTFQELLDSELEFTGYDNMLRLLRFNGDDNVIQKMVNRFKVTHFDIDDAVDRIAAERKIAYVRHTSTFLYYALINPKAKGHIHVIKDCIYLYHPMVVTKKHSPFSNRLNEIISRLLESGITKKWRSDYIYDVPPPVKPFLALSNDHMYGVFCILAFGHAVGVLVFVIEVIHSRFNTV